MTKKFAIRDRTTHQYQFVEDIATATALIAQQAFNLYVNFYNNGDICSVVEENDDGSTTWYSPRGERIPSPEELQAEIERLASLADPFNTPQS